MTDDDLTPWRDTPLVRALTSRGADNELAGEEEALAAFQASHRRRRRGVVRLLGTGVTSVALAGIVGGGVAAAAYTRSLPGPVQDVMHEVLGPIGVPAPQPHNDVRHSRSHTVVSAARPIVAETTASTPVPTQSLSPSAEPSTSTHASPAVANPVGPAPVASVSPTTTPSASLSPTPTATATPTATPSPSTTPTDPAGDPSTWSMTAAASSQMVRVHADVRITGTLYDAAGQPVPDHRVVVRVHSAGGSGWQDAAVRRTAADGSVRGRLDDMTQNTVVVLGAGHGVKSSPLRIVVRPTLTASATPTADGASYVVTVSADGGDPGDVVDLFEHTANGWQQVGAAQLDDSTSASFSVPAPKRQRGYVLRLPVTNVHGNAATRIVLQPPG